ncbi:MAG: sensor histidine kinase [Emticicia sp.]|nr:sensor histidine kinase [Emticicia sp.]
MSKRKRIIFHISFWLFFIFSGNVLNFIGGSEYQFEWNEFLKPLNVSSLFFRISISYMIIYVFNRFFDSKQYTKLVFGFLGVCAIYITARYLVEEVLYFKFFGFHNYSEESRRFPFYATDNIQNVIYYSFNAFFLKMIEDFFRTEKEKNALLTEKLNAEQAFLKSQLNPHFLFNTLNNIYSLTLTQSPKAPEAVLKLSELMRYMLYESNVEKINLETEVKYLKNFVELQKFRYSKQTYIDFQVAGDLHSQKVAPLLLIAFVENAFKHGEVSVAGKSLVISLLLNQNNLNFTVKNFKKDQNKDEVGGVGLENVRRRLDLIYPNQYSLDIEDTKDTYFCELNLIL